MTDQEKTRIVHTHCLICEQLCGLAVTVEGERIHSIRPDKLNPYSWRDFCVKGQQAAKVAASPWRIRTPMKRVGDRFVEASYKEAVEDIAARLQVIMDRHGRDAVAGGPVDPPDRDGELVRVRRVDRVPLADPLHWSRRCRRQEADHEVPGRCEADGGLQILQ